jgi:glycosyltransferase involved in cell wall biosynthesis
MLRNWFLILLTPAFLFSKEKICLNMIVKDEAKVIKRCLDSVKPYIDYWVIVDTGSKDGTQKIIKEHMKSIPGKLFERPWKNWGETRTEALKLCQQHGKGDYILFMDADDILEFKDGYRFENLSADLYHMWRGIKGFTYLKPQLVKKDLPWRWVGVTHEYLDCPQSYTTDTLLKVTYQSLDGGATWKDPKQKFMKNVALLEEGLKKEPDNARYAFYLAESYRDAGDKAKALEWYQKRIKMGGWAEEVYWSLFQSGLMMKEIGIDYSIYVQAFLHAHKYRPHRSEALYYATEALNSNGEHAKAYELIKNWEFIPQPIQKDGLFNMDWIQDYGFDFQLSIASYYVGQYDEAVKICDRLLKNPNLPDDWRNLTVSNREFPIQKMKKINHK